MIVALLLVIVALSIVTSHLGRWAKAIDLISVHADVAVGEVAQAAKKMNASASSTKQSADEINKRLPAILDQLSGTVTKTNTLLDTADGTMHKVGTTVDSVDGLIKHTDDRLAEADAKLDSVIGRVNTTLDSASGVMQAGQTYMNGPLTALTNEATDTLIPIQWGAYDFQQSLHGWLYPAKQSKLIRLYKFSKGVAGFAQPAYFTLKIARDN